MIVYHRCFPDDIIAATDNRCEGQYEDRKLLFSERREEEGRFVNKVV